MLTGLMYHRPEDPLGFLENCLQKARELGGPECVAWDTFIMPDRKPLPPITTAQGKKAPCKLGMSSKYSLMANLDLSPNQHNVWSKMLKTSTICSSSIQKQKNASTQKLY